MELITFMEVKFPSKGITILPEWLRALHQEYVQNPPLYIRIFILKIILNKDHIIKNYAKFFYEILVSYLAEKSPGGKGFHYFARDICYTIIDWQNFYGYNEFFKEGSQNYFTLKKLTCSTINNLIKIAADEKKESFKNNLIILSKLADFWKNIIFIEKNLLYNMISLDESKENSHLWRITGFYNLIFFFCQLFLFLKNDNFLNLLKRADCFRIFN